MVLAVSQSKMEVEFGISLIIPAITCVAYFGRSNITNGSTILFMFTFPVNLDLFNLSTVSFGSISANIS